MANQALTPDTRILLLDADIGEIYSWAGSGIEFQTLIPDSDCCTVLLREAIQVCTKENWQILGFVEDSSNGEIEVRVRTLPESERNWTECDFAEGLKTIPAHLFSA